MYISRHSRSSRCRIATRSAWRSAALAADRATAVPLASTASVAIACTSLLPWIAEALGVVGGEGVSLRSLATGIRPQVCR